MGKLLMISPCCPVPPWSGAKIRVKNIIREISKYFTIDLVCMYEEEGERYKMEKEETNVNSLNLFKIKKSKTRSIIDSLLNMEPYRWSKFENENFDGRVQKLRSKNKYTAIWIHMLNMAKYVNFNDGDEKIILDRHNADSLGWRKNMNTTNPLQILFSFFNYRLNLGKEKNIVPRCDYNLSVSSIDMRHTSEIIDDSANLVLVNNGVNLDFYNGGDEKSKNVNDSDTLIFCGGLDRRRNIEAVAWFVEKVFPIIKREKDSAEILIVGRNPSDKIKKLSKKEGVNLHPDVGDVRPYYNRSDVSVVPIFQGGGSKLKIFESLAMRVPVVLTPQHGLEDDVLSCVRVASDETEFAREVINILMGGEKVDAMKDKGRRVVEDNYSWKSIVEDAARKTGLIV